MYVRFLDLDLDYSLFFNLMIIKRLINKQQMLMQIKQTIDMKFFKINNKVTCYFHRVK